MKKLLKTVVALVLVLSTLLFVACGKMDVNSEEFYSNLASQMSSAKKMTYTVTATITDDGEIDQTIVNGGISLEKDKIYMASEVESISKDAQGEILYKSINNVYFYNNKLYEKEGYAYGSSEMEYEYEVDDLFENSNGMPTVLSTVIDMLDGEISEFTKAIMKNNKDDIAEFYKETMEIFFTSTQTKDGYEIALDAEKVKTFYNDLKTMTVEKVINKYYGEDAFEELEEGIYELLNKTVNELKADINKMTDNKFDELLVEVISSLSGAIGGQPGVTPEQMIESVLAQYGDMKLSEIIEMASIDVNAIIGAVIGMCKTKTIFEIAEVDQEDLEIVDGFINDYVNKINLVMKLDKKGNLKNVVLSVTDLVVDGVAVQIESKVEFGKEFKDIASKTSAIATKAN